jgi:hypothetical protein
LGGAEIRTGFVATFFFAAAFFTGFRICFLRAGRDGFFFFDFAMRRFRPTSGERRNARESRDDRQARSMDWQACHC